MSKAIITTEVANKLDIPLEPVFQGEEQIVMEKDGVPVAAIISIKDYEEYRRLLAKQVLRDLVRKQGAEAERQGLTEEQLQEEVKASRPAFFEEHYGRKLP